MSTTRHVGAATMLLVWMSVSATAQTPDPAFRPKHLVVSAGMMTTGRFPVGDSTGELRQNGMGTPAPFTLFRAESEFERAYTVDGRIALALTRLLALEVGATYGAPELAISVSQDTEAGPTTQIAETTTQYTVDVSALFQIPGVKLGSRLRPYALGGGGYLRQLPEGRLLVETGHTIHLGGGLRYWLRGGAITQRAFGLRAEARAVRRGGGINFEDARPVYPAFSVMGFVGF